MYAIYGNMCHQYTPNVSIYTIHGSYGIGFGCPSFEQTENIIISFSVDFGFQRAI